MARTQDTPQLARVNSRVWAVLREIGPANLQTYVKFLCQDKFTVSLQKETDIFMCIFQSMEHGVRLTTIHRNIFRVTFTEDSDLVLEVFYLQVTLLCCLLVGQWVGWLIGQLLGCLGGWLIGWLIFLKKITEFHACQAVLSSLLSVLCP